MEIGVFGEVGEFAKVCEGVVAEVLKPVADGVCQVERV